MNRRLPSAPLPCQDAPSTEAGEERIFRAQDAARLADSPASPAFSQPVTTRPGLERFAWAADPASAWPTAAPHTAAAPDSVAPRRRVIRQRIVPEIEKARRRGRL